MRELRQFGTKGQLQHRRLMHLQVSRRLTRRIKRALHEKQYGYVKIAVYAYQHLLSESTKEGCPYSFTYFSKELVEQPDTVVRPGTSMADARQVTAACVQVMSPLICPHTPCAVQIQTLLTHPDPLVKCLGADLLGSYIAAQVCVPTTNLAAPG